MCKLCDSTDPVLLQLEKQFLRGAVKLSQIEKVLGVRHETVYNHFTKHVTPHYVKQKEARINSGLKGSANSELEFYTSKLDRIIAVLEKRIEMISWDQGNEKSLAAVIKELRETLKLYAELKGKLQTAPQVTVNVQLQKLNKIQQLVLQYGTPLLRKKIAEVLGAPEDQNAQTEAVEHED